MTVHPSIAYVWGNLVVGLPARSAGKLWASLHHLQGSGAYGRYLGENGSVTVAATSSR